MRLNSKVHVQCTSAWTRKSQLCSVLHQMQLPIHEILYQSAVMTLPSLRYDHRKILVFPLHGDILVQHDEVGAAIHVTARECLPLGHSQTAPPNQSREMLALPHNYDILVHATILNQGGPQDCLEVSAIVKALSLQDMHSKRPYRIVYQNCRFHISLSSCHPRAIAKQKCMHLVC